jgi:hypothetical protein
MDLPYWREFYLLGEAEELAEKIRAMAANLGGCEHIVLNPLDWGMEQLELLAAEGEMLQGRLREGLRQVKAAVGAGGVSTVVEVAPWSRIPEARALLVPRDD